MSELQIAFAAAAIAFIFFLLGEALQKAYDRSKVHYEGLVSFERLLNLQLDELFVIEQQTLSMRATIDSGGALIDLPRPVVKPEGLFLELLDIDLVNRLFSASLLLRRANNDIENLREAYARILDRYLDKTLPREGYVENAGVVVGAFERLVARLRTYREDEVEDILARVRVRLAEGRPKVHRAVRGLTLLLMANARPLSDERVRTERHRITEELTVTRARTRGTPVPTGSTQPHSPGGFPYQRGGGGGEQA